MELAENRHELISSNDDDKFLTEIRVFEKSRTFIWVRLYIKEELGFPLEAGDVIRISYLNNEYYDMIFGSYEKLGLHKDTVDQVVNYIDEYDKKILCLMVDIDEIHKFDNIPYIRTLFKASRYYQYQILRFSELTFTHILTDTRIEYFDISF